MIPRLRVKPSKLPLLLRLGSGLFVGLPLLGQTPLSISVGALPAATVGQSYSGFLNAAGGTPPYQWMGTGLPAGLTLNPQSGGISGTPSAAGVFTVSIQVTDAAQHPAIAAISFSLTVTSAPPSPIGITTVSPLSAGTVGLAYSQPLSASGGTPPYTWSISSGNAGPFTLDASTGTLHGTPLAPGTFTFTVQVADSVGATAVKSFSIVVSASVLTVALTSPPPSGTVAIPYSQQLPLVATGGTPPYQWSVTGGNSPAPGLTFNPGTLTISGTPTAAGTFTFTIQATDSNNQNGAKSVSITIAPPGLSITTSRQLPDGWLNAAYTTTVAALGGAPPYTWSAAGLPAGLSMNSSTGTIAGTPTAAGSFGIAITVTDSTLANFSDRFTLNIKLPATPAIQISGLPATAAPAQQYPLQITIASSFPAPIAGQAILTFSPDTGPTDQTVQFASGGTIASFSIPVGATTAVSDVPLAIQTGTASGTINISLLVQAGGIDITPVPAPAISTQIAPSAPVITNVQVTRGSSTLSFIVSGYSTAREVVQATFTFLASSGQSLQSAASSISVPVESLFGTWFQDPANSAYGTQFVLTQPFNTQGDPNAVIPQSVTLTNRLGSTAYAIQ